MEALSWSWSVRIEFFSTLLIALAFFVMMLRVRRREMQAWLLAWCANLAALVIALMLWQPLAASAAWLPLASTAYFFAKTQFVVLLVGGATNFALETPRSIQHGPRSVAIAVASALVGFLVGSLDRVGMLQSVTMGAILIAGAIQVTRTKAPGWPWLATGFWLRMLLAAAESGGYAMRSLYPDRALPDGYAYFMAIHPALDAGAEAAIAVGCLLMLRSWLRR
jgi:hypothetical protein